EEVVKGLDHAFGVKMTKSQSTRYDYSGCQDPELNDLTKELAILTEKIKARESFLKGLKKPLTVIDEETGDISKIFPPVKLSTDVIKCTF
ncbi:MAG: hypothetical protein NXI00_22555, partial [Cytophagales bacterium]|nr:hypothetical protein [Cytophagales bacterium]